MAKPASELVARLGFAPERAIALWQQALTHRSAEGLPHYERLEFLGDAVLKLVVSEWLYTNHPGLDEGEMTKVRARVVKDETLAEVARQLELGDYLILGASEKRTRGKSKPGTLASAFEAILGVVYLSEGYAAADRFLATHLGAEMAVSLRVGGLDNYKAVLQEFTQGSLKTLPEYRLVAELGPEHDRAYEIGVWVAGEQRGTGRGHSKKAAEQSAARAALESLRREQASENGPPADPPDGHPNRSPAPPPEGPRP